MQLVIFWRRWPQKYQTLEILIRVEFLCLLKTPRFSTLLNSSIACAKIVNCILFLTESHWPILIELHSFCDDGYFMAAAHCLI